MIAAQPTRVGSESPSDEAAWASALAANTPDAYHSYLSRFPAGDHVGDAVRALRALGAFALQPQTRDLGATGTADPAEPAGAAGSLY